MRSLSLTPRESLERQIELSQQIMRRIDHNQARTDAINQCADRLAKIDEDERACLKMISDPQEKLAALNDGGSS